MWIGRPYYCIKGLQSKQMRWWRQLHQKFVYRFNKTLFGLLALNFNKPVEWSAFTIWLSLLLHRYGAQILCTKGIISTKQNHLISINSVCHIVHPPRHIDNLNGENPGSCLVIIAQNLDLNLVKESLKGFLKVELE